MASDHDLAMQLLRRASEDLTAVEAMAPMDAVADAIIGFHAQQAVEKSLKAVLAAREVVFPFVHDIDGLAQMCAEAGAHLPDELDDVDRLTPYAAGFRYDDDAARSVSRETAREWATIAVRWAQALL